MKQLAISLLILLAAWPAHGKTFRPAQVSASTELAIAPAKQAADGKTRKAKNAYWCTERNAKPPHTLTFHYDKPITINRVTLHQVALSLSHRLNHYTIEAHSQDKWVPLAEFNSGVKEFLQLQATLTPDDPRFYTLSQPDDTVNVFDFPDIRIDQLRLTVFDPMARVVEMQAARLTPEEKAAETAVPATPATPADPDVMAITLAAAASPSTRGLQTLGPAAFNPDAQIAFADRRLPGSGRATFAASRQPATLTIPLAPGRYHLLALSGDQVFPGPGCTLKTAGKSLRLSTTRAGDFAWDTLMVNVPDGKLVLNLEGPWLLNTLLIAPAAARASFDNAVNRLMLEATAESKGRQNVFSEPPTHRAEPTPTADDRRCGFIPYVPSIQQRIYRQTTPTPTQQQAPLALEAAPGSSRAVSLALYALEDLDQVQLTVQGELPGQLQRLHVRHHPQKVGRKGSRPQWAVVPERLEPREYSDVRQGESQQFYLILTLPADARPGRYQASLALTAAGKPPRALPLTLEVYPFTLPDVFPDSCFGMYHGDRDGTLFDLPEPQLRAALRDMRRHNMSTIVLYNSKTQPMDEAFLKRVNAILDAEHYPRQPLPYACGGAISAEQAAELAAIVKRNQWRELLFYPVDEPFAGGPERLNRAIKLYNELKQAPGVRTFSTVTQNDINAIGHGLDVRCYTVNHETFQPDRIRAECAALPDKEFWWYSNGAREYPDAARFKAGFFHYRTGARGQFYWAYHNPRGDMFNDFDEDNSDHVAIHILDDQIVSTLQWEAIREGIDDYRYLRLLEQLSQSQAKTRPQAAAAATQLLNEIRAKLPGELGEYQTRFGHVLDIHEQSWWDAEEFDLQRRRVAAAIMAFSKP